MTDDRALRSANALHDLNIRRLGTVILWLHRAVLAGLCVLALVTPVLQVAGSDALPRSRHLTSTLAWFTWGTDLWRIDGGAGDGALDTQILLGQIGLLLVLVGLLVALVTMSTDQRADGAPPYLTLGAVLLLLAGTALTALGFSSFPDDRVSLGPAWGLVLPGLVAGWLLVGRKVAGELP